MGETKTGCFPGSFQNFDAAQICVGKMEGKDLIALNLESQASVTF
jgi:hypothetical protein